MRKQSLGKGEIGDQEYNIFLPDKTASASVSSLLNMDCALMVTWKMTEDSHKPCSHRTYSPAGHEEADNKQGNK